MGTQILRIVLLKLALVGGGAMGWRIARHVLADQVRRAGQVLLGKQDLRCIVSMLSVIQTRQGAKRVYLAGPMSGLPELNYPAFNAKAAELRARGWHVENPAENPAPPCGTWQGYMRMSLWQLMTCEAIYLMPGWAASKGAAMEFSVAQQLGLEIIESVSVLTSPKAAAISAA
ncbi:DUF4406 domain-containing protein [Comamonas antarctica]|uniref:DUF4406 domain-containing protein n=1 Tax=Comamonas antarctica TaxID=2743470 RepID=A0A6N1WZW1_9BURK|nr:DUF4406 domain-containing protein [Comamonas antarctica]QKV52621.1 DUF4406 domain-containing protein [Comamonas antarctica]